MPMPVSDGLPRLQRYSSITNVPKTVFACDGIKSRTRRIMLGDEHPASFPQYTHKVAYRTLVPMKDVLPLLGEYKTMRHHMHVGPNAHLIHYPVNSTLVGATVVVTDPNDWSVDQPNLLRVTRDEVEKAFANWCKPVRDLVSLFPQELDQWALFDMFEYPLPQYNFDRICLAGDAAHASSPHHGAGASMGVEDILCLSTLLRKIIAPISNGDLNKSHALKEAFSIYNSIRQPRTRWMVNSSRRACDLYQQPEWADPHKREKAESCFEELTDRSFKIWDFDAKAMVEETEQEAIERILAPPASLTNGTVPSEGPKVVSSATSKNAVPVPSHLEQKVVATIPLNETPQVMKKEPQPVEKKTDSAHSTSSAEEKPLAQAHDQRSPSPLINRLSIKSARAWLHGRSVDRARV
jgi:hypothetical protein